MAEAITEAAESLSLESQLPFPSEIIEKILLELGPPGCPSTIQTLLLCSMANKQFRRIVMSDIIWRFHEQRWMYSWDTPQDDLYNDYNNYQMVKGRFLAHTLVADLLEDMVDSSNNHQYFYNLFLQPELRDSALDSLCTIIEAYAEPRWWKTYSLANDKWLAIQYHAGNILDFQLRRLGIAMLKEEDPGFLLIMYGISMIFGGPPGKLNMLTDDMSRGFRNSWTSEDTQRSWTVSATSLRQQLERRSIYICSFLRRNGYIELPPATSTLKHLASASLYYLLQKSGLCETGTLGLFWLFFILGRSIGVIAHPILVGESFFAIVIGAVFGHEEYTLSEPLYVDIGQGLILDRETMLDGLEGISPQHSRECLSALLAPCNSTRFLKYISLYLSRLLLATPEWADITNPLLINGWYTLATIYCVLEPKRSGSFQDTTKMQSHRIFSELISKCFRYDGPALAQEFPTLKRSIAELRFEEDFNIACAMNARWNVRSPSPLVPLAKYKVGQVVYNEIPRLFAVVLEIFQNSDTKEPSRYVTMDESGYIATVPEKILAIPSAVPEEIITRFFVADRRDVLGPAFQTVDLATMAFVPSRSWVAREHEKGGEEQQDVERRETIATQ